MSDNIIPKPKRTYKKKVIKTTITADVGNTTPDVAAKVAADVAADVGNATPDVAAKVAPDVAADVAAKVAPDVAADVGNATTNVDADANYTSEHTPTNNGPKKITAKYEKFILYGLYLINYIQSTNTPVNEANAFDIARVFENTHTQTQFVDTFLNQFKDIKSSVKNEFKNRHIIPHKNNNYNKNNNISPDNSLVNNIVNAANNIPIQIIIIDNVKYFITKDNKLLDFHTQRFIKHFTP